MTRQRNAVLIAFLLGLAFVGLELGYGLRTRLTGLFVIGMAGGLLIGDVMGRTTSETSR